MHPTSTLHWIAALSLLALAACTKSGPDGGGPVQGSVPSADGSPIVYGVQGQGEPTLVFVHCWTCNHGFWDAQIDALSRDHRVVWLDLAGHGESGSHRTRYTMAAFGEDVAAVADAVGARRVVLVGHSMGGPVVVEAAKRLGDRVVGIVGVDTFYTAFQYPDTDEAIDTFVAPFENDYRATTDKMLASMFTPQADPAVVEDITGRFAGADPAVGVSALRELFDWNRRHAAADLQRFAGILYNINAAPTGKETPANDHVTLIPGVGHFVAQVRPQAFNMALLEILDRLER